MVFAIILIEVADEPIIRGGQAKVRRFFHDKLYLFFGLPIVEGEKK